MLLMGLSEIKLYFLGYFTRPAVAGLRVNVNLGACVHSGGVRSVQSKLCACC